MSTAARRVPAGPTLLAAIEAGRAGWQPLTDDARRVLTRAGAAARQELARRAAAESAPARPGRRRRAA